ncbi:MAG: hypothetical protein J0H68_08770 [Sphingobacteriia bacterium]|nr:hypothetical protein [Sphingobacteriia bacterium]
MQISEELKNQYEKIRLNKLDKVIVKFKLFLILSAVLIFNLSVINFYLELTHINYIHNFFLYISFLCYPAIFIRLIELSTFANSKTKILCYLINHLILLTIYIFSIFNLFAILFVDSTSIGNSSFLEKKNLILLILVLPFAIYFFIKLLNHLFYLINLYRKGEITLANILSISTDTQRDIAVKVQYEFMAKEIIYNHLTYLPHSLVSQYMTGKKEWYIVYNPLTPTQHLLT